MRTAVKKRLQYLILAVVTYGLGFYFLPDITLVDSEIASYFPVVVAALAYFIILPCCYWFWVIKAGEQKSWKLIIAFSLSALCARYSFPESIATYFDFINYVRYPIIAILILIECYLLVTIIKGLWQARSLSGDPRVHTFDKYKEDEKKLTAALPFAWEPASWYYALPRLTKKHVPVMGNLVLKSASWTHYLLLMTTCILLSLILFKLIESWSEIAAWVVAAICAYSVIFISANFRVANRYSLYVLGEKLIINNAFLSFMVIDLTEIESVKNEHFEQKESPETLILGAKKQANVLLTFKQPQPYVSMLGQFIEQHKSVRLNVEQYDEVVIQLEQVIGKDERLA